MNNMALLLNINCRLVFVYVKQAEILCCQKILLKNESDKNEHDFKKDLMQA